MEMVNEAVQIEQWSFLSQLKIMHVDFSDYFLWCTVLVMFCDPFFRSVVGLYESRHQVLSRFMRKNLAFFTYCSLSYANNFLAFLCFQKAVGMQPRVRDFQRNEALIIGYIFLLLGICMKTYVYSYTSLSSIMGGLYFKLDSMPRNFGPNMYNPYYHPFGTTSVICYFGFSVIRASAAGIMLTIAFSVGLCTASKLEKYVLKWHQKQQLEQYTFTPINRSPSDQEDKPNQHFENKLD